KDLRRELTLTPEKWDFKASAYTMKQVADILAKFLGDECNRQEPQVKVNANAGFFLGGYSKPGSLGESWSLEIIGGVPQAPKILRADHEVGLSWGGAGEILQRMIVGYGTQLFAVLGSLTQPQQNPALL